ncbi:sulfite exporter TauE/SafE family protein [Pararhodobacter sp.]|uniref:sulfite exporter TauE/SafE family protein n=1 Tax=Pararhodobacter sp. TaxID=2127056 RepID=UPI002AFF4ADF|nr:sulfite exporter TauE/SafE family protein [Pararhodobacter sp.]
MSLPFELSAGATAYLALVIFVAAFIRGYSGFGYPVLVIAAGALVINPLLLIPMAVMGDLVLCAQHWRASRAHVHWPTVIRLGIGAALGMLAGIWTLSLMTEEFARIAVGVMVLLASLLMLIGWTIPGRAGPAATLGMGVVSGLTTPAGVAGQPAVMLVSALGMTPLVFRATLLAYFVALDVMTFVQFSLAGLVDTESLIATALSVPLVVVGSAIGARMVLRSDPVLFRRATIGVLMLMAVLGLAKGLM